MIISPPFLPAKPAGASLPDPDADALWVDKAMAQPSSRAPDSHALEGSFPLSAALMWHNGIHIQAPLVNNAYLPVRAVADGKVIYAKEGAKPNANKHDPQNYYPWSAHDIGWSDNGIVIIEHDNEIGATKDAPHTPTRIRFYSLYMHLSSLGKNDKTKAAWTAGDVIHRKEELGTPGQIYGHSGQIHFEICCDKANLEKIIGRPPGWREFDPHVAPTADGRTDSVFGSFVVYLPATTPTQTQAPTSHRRATSTTTIGAPQWVRIRYDKGTAFVQSFAAMGEPMGAELQDKDFEYNMYKEANRRHKNLGTSDSSPSGWYELLRFGRNLGPDKLPTDAAHWRSIPKAGGGSIWADLNAKGTFKFSDADFLPEMGWNCFDDDATPHDQCLDSINMRLWIHDRERKDDHKLKSGALAARLGEPSVQKKLRRAICLFPSEWDRSTIQARYQWLRKDGASDSGLGDEGKWQTFVHHCEAMTFDDLPQDYLNAKWRFHPSEFISFFTRCGWIGKNDLENIYPKTDESVRAHYRTSLNRVCRKYGINASFNRMAHFYGQGAVESGQLQSMIEFSQSVIIDAKGFKKGGPYIPASKIPESTLGHWYGAIVSEFDPYFSSEKYNSRGKISGQSYSWILGNCGDVDAQKFRGRGFKQLTGRSNYAAYWRYRGWITKPYDDYWWNDPKYLARAPLQMKKVPAEISDPQQASIDAYTCIDTGAYYITFERPHVLQKIDKDGSIADSKSKAEMDAERGIIESVTWAINGGENGLPERIKWTRAAKEYFL